MDTKDLELQELRRRVAEAESKEYSAELLNRITDVYLRVHAAQAAQIELLKSENEMLRKKLKEA